MMLQNSPGSGDAAVTEDEEVDQGDGCDFSVRGTRALRKLEGVLDYYYFLFKTVVYKCFVKAK